MNKTTFILLITLIISYINTAYIQAQTQRVTVQGSILEKDTQFPVEQATIQLLSLPDSNYVGTFIKYYKISQLIHTQSIAN